MSAETGVSGRVSRETSASAVELASICVARGTERVLDGVSLRVARGERVALVGANGVGKSTLLDVVLGLRAPSSGTVSVLGGRPPSRGVGLVTQDPDASLLPWLSVRRNVELPLRIAGVDEGQRRRAFEAIRARFDPARAIPEDLAPTRLSGGQRQAVALMRAWVGSPSLVVADEPLSAIDMVSRLRLRDAMRAACEAEGTTLFFVSHDLAEVVTLASRAVVLAGRPARIVADLALHEGSLAELERVLRGADGPSATEPAVEGERHPSLRGALA